MCSFNTADDSTLECLEVNYYQVQMETCIPPRHDGDVDRLCRIYFTPPLVCPILEAIKTKLQLFFRCYNGVAVLEEYAMPSVFYTCIPCE